MRGHHHNGDPSLTQNQGNTLGDRPCVRQSRLYREHVGGNAMKDIMGQAELKWDTTKTQGAYPGGRVYDPNSGNEKGNENEMGNEREMGNGEARELEIAMDAEEETAPAPQTAAARANVQQEQQQEQQQQQQQLVEEKEEQQQQSEEKEQQGKPQPQEGLGPAQGPVAGRAFRAGAGQANRQTYNIFTGE